MTPHALRIDGLWKEYAIGGRQRGRTNFREAALDLAAAPLRWVCATRNGVPGTRFWALRDVSFEAAPGEVIGVIGRNGAGKSTLLKLLSRITAPTRGRIEITGRITSLLEVGTGFHPELTGRENIYLNGAILGMRRMEIRRKFDEIVAFAEVDKFLDTPVKRYSSGMYVRLAFAVAAHLEPEILIVDEVLAVGDAAFQKKCLGKMSAVAERGRTVLFVSHNLAAIRALTSRGLVLNEGQLVTDAPIEQAVQAYLSDSRSCDHDGGVWRWQPGAGPGGSDIEVREVRLCGSRNGNAGAVMPDENFELIAQYEQRRDLVGARFGFQLVTAAGEVAFTTTDHHHRTGTRSRAGHYRSTCEIPGGLLNTGRYSIRVWAGIPGQRQLIPPFEIGFFTVEGFGNQGTLYEADNWPGVVCPKLAWRVETLN